FYESGVDDQLMAYPAESFDGDNPSYRQAINGPDAAVWRSAMDAERENLETHDAYEEVPEDTLDS
ncbi:MAG: hypothetical protein SGPRY_003563, partial [Prymnesium sp.]